MNPVAQWVSVYVINSVWQIPVLALCTFALVKSTARGGARLHYRLWAGCLLLALVLPALPRVSMPSFGWRHHAEKSVAAEHVGETAKAPSAAEQIAIYTDEMVTPAKTNVGSRVIFWLFVLSVLAGAVKLVRELLATRAVVRGAAPFVLPAAFKEALARTAESMEVGPVLVRSSAAIRCPATVSWPRAMLLVPEDFASAPEADAVAAIGHELAHVKRRDFAANVVFEVMSVAAFYHPALHWVKRRVAESREVVCDEMAAAATMGRTAYARSLVSLAEGAAGSDEAENFSLGVLERGTLETRIMRLIEERVPLARRYGVLSVVGCWVVFGAVCVGAMELSIRPSAAQGVTAEFKAPALDVVSVKPVKDSGGWQSVGSTADGIKATDAQLWLLIRTAFEAQFFADNQIVGEPSWSRSEHYDIEGKVSETDVAKLRNLNNQQETLMTQAMLQAVLAERFHMKVHQEDREGPIYELVVAKNGPKLKKATAGETYSNGFKEANGSTMGAGALIVGRDHVVGQAQSLEALAKALTGQNTGRVVVDKTGLTGKYDFALTWTPDQGAVAPGPDGVATDLNGPSIFTAIQEQLGLKLEPAKGPVKTLVIDHIERPSAN